MENINTKALEDFLGTNRFEHKSTLKHSTIGGKLKWLGGVFLIISSIECAKKRKKLT